MTWEDLKTAIAAVIKTNGNQEITGALLQAVLISMVDQTEENIPEDVQLIKSTDSTAASDTTAYSSLKADLRFLLASQLNQVNGIAGLNSFGKIPEFLLPSFIKSIMEKQGSIQGVYNVDGGLYNGLIADIIGDTTVGVTIPVTDQFEVVLYNHDTIEHFVTLGLNLWRDADDDLVVGSIKGSAQYETILLYPQQIYRAKAFSTGQGLAIEANIVGTTGPVDWTIIQNIPDATPYKKGVVTLGATSGKAAEGDHVHTGIYAPTSHTHTKSNITDFPTTWAWASLSGVPTASTSQAGIVQLGTGSGQAAQGSHTHLKADITDFAHTHTFASLTDKPTSRSGYGITDAAASVHYHQVSDISDFPTIKKPEYFSSPISGSVSANVSTYAGVIARMNGDLALNFSGTIYGDYEIMIYNDSGVTRNLDLSFYNAVQTIKGSAGSTSITINHGQMYRAKFHYIYAAGDSIMGVADVN